MVDRTIIQEHRAVHKALCLWENKMGPYVLRIGYHHLPGDRGESQLLVLAQPQDPARGSPEVSLPQMIHGAPSNCVWGGGGK